MLYITYKTECFSAKRLKETGLQCYSKNFGLLLLKSVITKAQEYEVGSKLKI